MTRRLLVRLWFLGVVAPPLVASTARALAPGAPFFADRTVAHALLGMHCVAKAGCLWLAAATSAKNAGSFDRDNPVRLAWVLLSLGFFAFFLGQACYAPAQIVRGVDAAFPSESPTPSGWRATRSSSSRSSGSAGRTPTRGSMWARPGSATPSSGRRSSSAQ